MSEKKGNRHENEAMRVYRSFGFQTWKPSNKVIVKKDKDGKIRYISLQQDIAEAFDFIAWNEIEVHLVQVKSQESHASKARKKIDGLNMPISVITQVVLARIPRKKEQFISWTLEGVDDWDRQYFNAKNFFGVEIEDDV